MVQHVYLTGLVQLELQSLMRLPTPIQQGHRRDPKFSAGTD